MNYEPAYQVADILIIWEVLNYKKIVKERNPRDELFHVSYPAYETS